jgi:hypothetical protein
MLDFGPQQQNDLRSAARLGGRGRLRRQNMTRNDHLLMQKRTLCQHAFKETRDLNEAYLLVHCVISHALGQADSDDENLVSAMSVALTARAQRLADLAAIA